MKNPITLIILLLLLSGCMTAAALAWSTQTNTSGSNTAIEGGYTSAAATTITLPITTTAGGVTGISQQLGAVRGQQFSFIVDNTGGADDVTIALGTGGSLSDAATITASAVAFGRVVVANGATGMAQFTMMFTGGDGVTPGSATGYTLTRTA